MKKILIFLLLLAMASQVYSQKKGKIDPKDVKIDSLTNVTVSLSGQLDSVSKDLETYFGLYTVIKDKVIKYNFDPSNASFLIDSLKASRDSTMLGLTKEAESISALKLENQKLKGSIDSLNLVYADKTRLVAELKQMKELLDANIISQEDFDAKKKVIMEQWK